MMHEPDNRARHTEDRAASLIEHEAARFIAREAGTDSLITVIRAESGSKGDHVRVFVSIYPEDKAQKALAFLARQREAFSDHLKKHTHLRIPRVDFLLENGDHFGSGNPENKVV